MVHRSTGLIFGAPPDVVVEYLATLELMREALDYLRRLPAHPMTQAMANRLSVHIDDPGRAARERFMAEQLAEQAAVAKRDRLLLVGASRTTVGTTVIEAELLDRALTLRAPALATGQSLRSPEEFGALVLQRLAAGERLQLRQSGEVPPPAAQPPEREVG